MDAAPEYFNTLPLEQRLALMGAAPSAVFMTGEDALRVTCIAAIGGLSVTISGRFLTRNGRIVPFANTYAVPSTRTATSVIIPLGEGWLLNCVVVANAATPIIGQAWAQVHVVRGVTSVAVLLAELASGYITSTQTVAYPPGGQRDTLTGQAYVRSITGTDPGAGAEISESVPTGARWRLIAIRALLVTDATVANRAPILLIDDGATTFFASDPPEVQVASGSWSWVYGAGLGRQTGVNGVRTWAFPNNMILRGACRIRTQTTNLQAGDNWGAPQLYVEEWIEGA